MIRKRIEETDAQGRTVTTIIEEPDDAVARQNGAAVQQNDAVVGQNNATVEEHPGAVVEEYDEATVYSASASGGAPMIAMLSWLVGLAGIAVLGLLALRLAFQAGNANATSFVNNVYDITGPLVRPFLGIADGRSVDGGGVFHPETAIAMGVYLVATALVMMAMHMLAATMAGADEAPVVHRSRMVRGN